MKARKLLPTLVLAVLGAAVAIAGCGGSSGGGGGEPASLAPQDAPVYVEANLAPEAQESEDLDQLTQTVFGIEDVGKFIAEELEGSVVGDQELNFEEEVEPWLGEKIGLYLNEYDGNNFGGGGIAVAVTDSGAAEEFLGKHAEESKEEGEKAEEGEFEGNRYWVSPEDESVTGLIGDYLVYAQSQADFEEMAKTSEEGEGLGESPKFTEAMEAAPAEGIGKVYVDVGGLIEETRSQIPPEAEAFFNLIQIEPKRATMVGTVVPHTEQVELDVSTNLGRAVAGTGGDASQLLESLPASADVGFASADFGRSFSEGIHAFSEQGVPGQIEPGELEGAFEAMGINVESLGEALGDVGGFVEGSAVGSLGGAMIVESKDAAEARNMVANIGLLLRASGTKGVTAAGGKVSGFSIHAPELGPKPLIVGAAGEKIVIAYGPKAAAQALRSQAKTLGSTPGFEAGKSALGSTPISAFVQGGPTLKLVDALLSPEEKAKLAGARPYLQKISYLAIGSEAEGKTTTAKLIVGLQK